MVTDVYNIILGVKRTLDDNHSILTAILQKFQPGRTLKILIGERRTIPMEAFPTIEIEPTSSSGSSWATTRAQRPEFECDIVITVTNQDEENSVQYVAALTQVVAAILSSPGRLQFIIPKEMRATIDSGIRGVSYNTAKEGTLRIATLSWWCMVHEPYHDRRFDQPKIGRTPVISDLQALHA